MPEDTSIKSLFDHAKGRPVGPSEFPSRPTVWATYVEHAADQHPQKQPNSRREADSVLYANGELTLSQDGKTLRGETKVWRNVHDEGAPPFFGAPGRPEDAFDDDNRHFTIEISVNDAGGATVHKKLNGKNFLGRPPHRLAANYENGMYVEKARGVMRSLSFSLGSSR